MNVQEIGEIGLLSIVQKFCPADIIGDDAALLTPSPNQSLVITTDMLVEGVHFSDLTMAPEDVGWKAAAANLSDLAAMGAFPLAMTVALGLSPKTPVSWVEKLYQGLTDCLKPYHTPIVGGDICRSPIITLAITAFGQVNPATAIRRSTCQPGSVIVATGYHGASRAGLELLLHAELSQFLDPAESLSLIQAHQRPKPRLDVIPLLQDIVKSQSPSHPPSMSRQQKRSEPTGAISPSDLSSSWSRIAGMDSSDGLANAIIQICQGSGVGARIDRHQIPIPPLLKKLVSEEQALSWALYGGEDFELVLGVPLQIGQKLVNQIHKLNAGAAIVGTTTNNTDILLVDSQGVAPDQPLSLHQGFQHF